MSILLIGNIYSKSALRLADEALRMDIDFDMVSRDDILWNESIPYTATNIDFLNYDKYFFRGLGDKTNEMQLLARYLVAHGKKVIEACFAERGFPEDKLVPPSREGNYLVPRSQVVDCLDSDIKSAISEFEFPFIVKKLGLGSSQGKMVELVDDEDGLKTFMEGKTGPFLFQEYHPITHDTRVLVVGGKCLGGFDRYKGPTERFLTNRKKGGGKFIKSDLLPGQIKAAVEATKQQGLMIAGIDMFIAEDGSVGIFEVNSSPQFTIFEKYTKLNVAEEILTLLSA